MATTHISVLNKCILCLTFAGQETTSSTLSFMLAEAGKHPDIENRWFFNYQSFMLLLSFSNKIIKLAVKVWMWEYSGNAVLCSCTRYTAWLSQVQIHSGFHCFTEIHQIFQNDEETHNQEAYFWAQLHTGIVVWCSAHTTTQEISQYLKHKSIVLQKSVKVFGMTQKLWKEDLREWKFKTRTMNRNFHRHVLIFKSTV